MKEQFNEFNVLKHNFEFEKKICLVCFKHENYKNMKKQFNEN